MGEELFVCAACGNKIRIDATVGDCSSCHKTYCPDCMTGEGLCIACAEKEKKEKEKKK